MRALVLDNVRYWLEEFRFDGLRLDAVHAIVDPSELGSHAEPRASTRHVVRDIVRTARDVYPHAQLIAEDDRNDPMLVDELGLDAIWADDFHHQLRVTLTGERDGYYAAYEPGVAELARCIERGWLYEGQVFSPSAQSRGKPADSLPGPALRLLHPEPRPGRQPRARRAPVARCVARRLLHGLHPAAVPADDAAAVHGPGVGGLHAVPVLHRSRPRAGRAGGARAPRGVQELPRLRRRGGARAASPIRRPRAPSSSRDCAGKSAPTASMPASLHCTVSCSLCARAIRYWGAATATS